MEQPSSKRIFPTLSSSISRNWIVYSIMFVAWIKFCSYQASILNKEGRKEEETFFFLHWDCFVNHMFKCYSYLIQIYRLIQPPRPEHQSLPERDNLAEDFVLRGGITTVVNGWVTSVGRTFNQVGRSVLQHAGRLLTTRWHLGELTFKLGRHPNDNSFVQ